MTSPNIDELETRLRALLGDRNVSREQRMLERASVDGARMSPVISELLPLGHAELVAFPTEAEQVGHVVAAAVELDIPVTPRGKGTGNYGQGIPSHGGLVLDFSRLRTIVEVGDGVVTAEAGVTFVALEQAVRESGQELWMYPSTLNSTLGGFLSGGSGGTGTIEHGANHMGFVVALDVVRADGDPSLHHVEGDEAQHYVHNYGTAGFIVRATVRLDPLHDWRGLYASFDDFATAISVIREIGRLEPLPRLVSADTVEVSRALPADPGIIHGRASLRSIIRPEAIPAAVALTEGAGGRIEEVREGVQVAAKLSAISYNHPIEWLMKTRPGFYFHVEVGGDTLVEAIDEVHAAVPGGGYLHIEAGNTVPIGMLAGEYRGPEEVYATIARLEAMGVGVHNPHQWNVDFELQRTIEIAQATDPKGLLNPGKLNADYTGPVKGAIR
ncbi:FAD-binding oxidoreductase [Microbacterium sediminicola]